MRKTLSRIGATLLLAAGLSGQVSAQVFTSNFDDITTLAGSGWVMTNASVPVGSTNWFQGTNVAAGGPFDSYSGAVNSYIAANYNNTGSTGTISNWLMTPNRTLRNGDVLTFYTRKVAPDSYADRLEVRMSTNGASTSVGTGSGVGDYTTLLMSVNPNLTLGVYPTTWTQYTVTISGLPAPTSGRFAFRYFVTGGGLSGTSSDYIGIDDVAYTPYVCPAFTQTPPAGALTNGAAGQSYSVTLGQTGALGAPSYAVTAGALPPGLTLSASGTISGTPTATGTFNFTATVSDNSGCSGSRAYSITVNAGIPPTPQNAVATAGNASANVSWLPLSVDPYGTSMTGYTVTAVEDGTKTCTTPGTGTTCTVSTLTNGMSYSFRVVATSPGGTSSPATTNSVIPQGGQTIDFPQPAPQRFGGLLSPQATATSGLQVTFVVDSGQCQKLMSGQIEFTAVGSCVIRASQAGDGAFTPAADVVRTVVIGKAEQIITFTSTVPANPKVGGTYVVAATGGASGNAVTFAIDAGSTSFCSIAGNTVTFDAVGSCAIRASQLGNASYDDAVQVQQVVAVGQGVSRVTISSSRNPSVAGLPVTFTVSVALDPNAPPRGNVAAVPTGTVVIMDGSTTLGTVTLVNGAASFTTAPLMLGGNHTIIANYSGDANYPPASSTAFTQTVLVVPTSVPTLGQWGLMLLSVLLAGVAVFGRRRTAN